MNEQNTRSFLTSIGVRLIRCIDARRSWKTHPELGPEPTHHFSSLAEVYRYWKARSLERLLDKHRVEHLLSRDILLKATDYAEISNWIDSADAPYPRLFSERARSIPEFIPPRDWRKITTALSARHGPIYREWLRDFYLEKLEHHKTSDAISFGSSKSCCTSDDQHQRERMDQSRA